jgi:hypothetical protein
VIYKNETDCDLVFIVSVITAFLYSLVAHGTGGVSWESAVRFGFIFRISLPLTAKFEGKKQMSETITLITCQAVASGIKPPNRHERTALQRGAQP